MFIYNQAQIKNLRNTAFFFSFLFFLCVFVEKSALITAPRINPQRGFGKHFTFDSYKFKQKNPLASPLAYTQIHLQTLHFLWGAHISHITSLQRNPTGSSSLIFTKIRLLFPLGSTTSSLLLSIQRHRRISAAFAVFLCWKGVIFMLGVWKTIFKKGLFYQEDLCLVWEKIRTFLLVYLWPCGETVRPCPFPECLRPSSIFQRSRNSCVSCFSISRVKCMKNVSNL